MGWAFLGVFAAFLFPGLTMADREQAFGLLAGNLLPAGFVGLMVASLVAAVMSSCDAFMIHGSALYTRNIYKSYQKPDAGQKQLLSTGRWASVAIVAGGLVFAFLFPSVIEGLKIVWKFTAYLGVAFWFGVIWKKANRYGAWGSVVVMIIISVYTEKVLNWTLPYQILAYLPAGILTMWLVSLLTPSEPKEKLRQFYTLLDTPVGEEQRLKAQGIQVKLEGISEGVKDKVKQPWFLPGKGDDKDGLILVDLLSIGSKFSWKRYRVDIIGFTVAAMIVVALLFLMILLGRIGG
jgi:Na+/proline symporter